MSKDYLNALTTELQTHGADSWTVERGGTPYERPMIVRRSIGWRIIGLLDQLGYVLNLDAVGNG